MIRHNTTFSLLASSNSSSIWIILGPQLTKETREPSGTYLRACTSFNNYNFDKSTVARLLSFLVDYLKSQLCHIFLQRKNPNSLHLCLQICMCILISRLYNFRLPERHSEVLRNKRNNMSLFYKAIRLWGENEMVRILRENGKGADSNVSTPFAIYLILLQ